MDTTLADLPDWTDRFLDLLEEDGLMNSAARVVGTTPQRIRSLREQSAEFDQAVERALEIANDALEKEARRRAVDGIEKGVYYQGDRVDTEVVYSDGLLTTLLKAKRPDEFAERKQITGAGGTPISIVVRTFGEAPPHPGDTLNGNSVDAAAKTPEIIDVEFRQLAPPSADVSLAEVLDMV